MAIVRSLGLVQRTPMTEPINSWIVSKPETIQKWASGKRRSCLHMLTRVKPYSLRQRFMIALHSPCGIVQTGLRICLQRKVRTVTALDAQQSVLSSPICLGIIVNTGMFHLFRWKYRGYSLLSRLRGGEGGIRTLGTGVSPYNGLANRRIRPLCHLSGVRAEIKFNTWVMNPM